MTTQDEATDRGRTGGWAKPVDKLTMGAVPGGAINLNVNGKHVTGPLKGFGQLWQKTYSVRLAGSDIAPEEPDHGLEGGVSQTSGPTAIAFYGTAGQIEPGDVALLNISGPGGATISTGILVIFADAESFSFMTPQGHIFAGMITFSAHEDDGVTVAQIQALVRASDPIYEMGCRVGVAHKQEDAFWHGTLRALAARFGVNGVVQQRTTLVDPRMQWSAAGDIWHNAAVRTTLYAPINAAKGFLRRA
jgi:hypothetical protein